jgi:hypothetical protein
MNGWTPTGIVATTVCAKRGGTVTGNRDARRSKSLDRTVNSGNSIDAQPKGKETGKF